MPVPNQMEMLDGSGGGTTLSGGGSGALAAALSPSNAAANAAAAAARVSSVASVVAPAGAGGVKQARAEWVPQGYVVEVFPLSGNTQPVYVSQLGIPSAVDIPGTRMEVPAVPGSSLLLFGVTDLAQIFVKNIVAGEGVSLRVRPR